MMLKPNESECSNTVRVSELFNIQYGHSLEQNRFEPSENEGVNFVSRTSANNGVSGKVLLPKNSNIAPIETPAITVALGGSVLSTFLQLEPFVTGYHVAVLVPKEYLSIEELLFYSTMIEANKWKYNYGRQANRTLKDIPVPRTMPDSWKNTLDKVHNSLSEKYQYNETGIKSIDFSDWRKVPLTDMFDIQTGDYKLSATDREEGVIPLVSASKMNNGVSSRVSIVEDKDNARTPTLYSPGNLTIAKDGSVGACFLQPESFYATFHVAVLTPKEKYNRESLLAIATLVEFQIQRRYKYGYALNDKRINSLELYFPENIGSLIASS